MVLSYFSNLLERISAVRLPQPGEILPVGSEVTVSGWGKTSDASNSVSQTLNYVGLTIISNLQCASVYGSSVIISSTVCAVGNPHHSTCNVSNFHCEVFWGL